MSRISIERCTECGTKARKRTTDYWSAKYGQVVGKDEYLCDRCLSRRKGARTLRQIHDERAAQ